MSGHAVGQGQASLGSSPLPLAAFLGSDQSEANRGGHPDRNPAERRTIQHPHPAEAPDKGQDQDKNGREGQKNKSRVMTHLEVFSIIQDPALSARAHLFSLP